MSTLRASRSNTILGVIVLLIFGAGLLFGLFEDSILTFVDQAPWLWIVGAAVIVALATTGGVLWMNQIDELAQRAHYVAWYWGGSTALAVLLFIAFAGPGLVQVIDFEGALTVLEAIYGRGAGFLGGVIFSLLTLTLGYLSWWVLYWVRKQ